MWGRGRRVEENSGDSEWHMLDYSPSTNTHTRTRKDRGALFHRENSKSESVSRKTNSSTFAMQKHPRKFWLSPRGGVPGPPPQAPAGWPTFFLPKPTIANALKCKVWHFKYRFWPVGATKSHSCNLLPKTPGLSLLSYNHTLIIKIKFKKMEKLVGGKRPTAWPEGF